MGNIVCKYCGVPQSYYKKIGSNQICETYSCRMCPYPDKAHSWRRKIPECGCVDD